jgi:hypothetical protein
MEEYCVYCSKSNARIVCWVAVSVNKNGYIKSVGDKEYDFLRLK